MWDACPVASHVLDDKNPGGNGRARSPVPGPPRPLGEAPRAVGATGNARARGAQHVGHICTAPRGFPRRSRAGPLSLAPPQGSHNACVDGVPVSPRLAPRFSPSRFPLGPTPGSFRTSRLRGRCVCLPPGHPPAGASRPGPRPRLRDASRFFIAVFCLFVEISFRWWSFLDVTRLASPLSWFINTLSSAIGNVLSGDSLISVALRSVFGDVTCSFLWAAVPCFFVASHRVLGWEPLGEQPPGLSLRSGAEIFASLLGRRVRRTLETPLGSHVLLARARRLLAEARLVCGPRPPSFGPRCVGLPDAALSRRALHPPPPPTRLPRLSAFGPGQNRARPLSHPPTETGPRAAPHSLVPGEGLRPSNVVDPPPDLT